MVVGIIVSYHPNIEELINNVINLTEELDLIVLIENGSDNNTQNKINNSLAHKKIKLVLMPENRGLAAAQNLGIAKGLEMGGNYFFFLDDDSTLIKGSIKQLLIQFESNPKLGIAACNVIHNDSSKIQKYWIKTNYFYKRLSFTGAIEKLENVNTVISSGSLISKEVITKCGFFREDYFIDYIDIEYCLRVRANGYSISVIRKAELIHKLGNIKSIRIGGLFHVYPTFHNSFRRFYMIRNRIWTWKSYACIFPGWFLIDLGNFLIDNFRVLLFETAKAENLKNILRGFKEGFFKKEKKK